MSIRRRTRLAQGRLRGQTSVCSRGARARCSPLAGGPPQPDSQPREPGLRRPAGVRVACEIAASGPIENEALPTGSPAEQTEHIVVYDSNAVCSGQAGELTEFLCVRLASPEWQPNRSRSCTGSACWDLKAWPICLRRSLAQIIGSARGAIKSTRWPACNEPSWVPSLAPSAYRSAWQTVDSRRLVARTRDSENDVAMSAQGRPRDGVRGREGSEAAVRGEWDLGVAVDGPGRRS